MFKFKEVAEHRYWDSQFESQIDWVWIQAPPVITKYATVGKFFNLRPSPSTSGQQGWKEWEW